jgi:hypothetical protein
VPSQKGRYVTLPTPRGNERWKLGFRKLRKKYAEIDTANRTIWFAEGQTVSELADTCIHEATHVRTGTGEGCDDGVERVVEDVAAGSVAMLLAMDLLRTEED